jgi:NADH:ubiquinone oxidoreductase subunit 2 (subunit N)
MISCVLQYILCFANLALVSAFCARQLCCRARQHQFETKIKILILMPLVTTLFTAGVALYYFLLTDTA